MFDTTENPTENPPNPVNTELAALAAAPPCSAVHAALEGVSVAGLDDDAALSAIAAWERVISHAQAQQQHALARFAQLRADPPPGVWHSEAQTYAAEEIALELKVTTRNAAHRLTLATALVTRLPATLAAVQRGEIDLARARVIEDLTAPLSDEDARRVEDLVLPRAGQQNPSQLRQTTRRAVIKIDPDGAQQRHRKRVEDRNVSTFGREDGMADLTIFGRADEVIDAFGHVDHLARALRGTGDPRTLDQLRADVALDLLTGRYLPTPPRGGNNGRAQVQVTVSLTTLLGIDQLPGELAGYGPITAELAREIAADATWRRLVTDPLSGACLDYGRRTYRPPAALVRHVRARDQTCILPGCRRPADQCDLDHRVPYPKGPTAHYNMAPLCRRHHGTKQAPGWRLDQDPTHPGRYTWTTPTGRRYTREPEPIAEPTTEQPQPPPEPEPPPPPPEADDETPPF